MSKVVETPEFLAWCLVHFCELRSPEHLHQPLATERSLKSIRAISCGHSEGRIVDRICIDRETFQGTSRVPAGFPIDEVLRMVGGDTRVAASCNHCPANLESIDSSQPGSMWAGCFGWLALDGPQPDLAARLDQLLQATDALPEPLATYCRRSRPAWYGLWIEGRITPTLAGQLADLLEPLLNETQVSREFPDDLAILAPRRLVAACEQSRSQDLVLAVELIPRGRIIDRDWHWPAHCPDCKCDRAPGKKPCEVCGCRQPTVSPRKRKTRGRRPFIPLQQFLGLDGEQRLLAELNQKRP